LLAIYNSPLPLCVPFNRELLKNAAAKGDPHDLVPTVTLAAATHFVFLDFHANAEKTFLLSSPIPDLKDRRIIQAGIPESQPFSDNG